MLQFDRFPLKLVISGGQTGADQAALAAASSLGMATGGTAPLGWRTSVGPAPWLANLGLVEHHSPAYPPRTLDNVLAADSTLILSPLPGEPGTQLTLKLARQHDKPVLLLQPTHRNRAELVETAYRFILDTSPQVLNVAGNRERDGTVHDLVYAAMHELLSKLLQSNLAIRK